ncbi:T9SS type A sorting domain-containing protein [Mariniflexile ostreae]|uniref:T9SS type A sorting domain-containing protein n=1 Tax=Mariniflexile ostreae TaxID=1520892 RepID=A0ABV5FAC7_9FLAO
MNDIRKKNHVLFVLLFITASSVTAQFVHPGLSHKKSDLDRMKYMVEAGIEPYASSFQLLASHPRASYNVQVAGGNTGMTTLTSSWNKFMINDGISAYYNALMWYITEDPRHAEKAVEVFRVWSDLKKQEINFALAGGRHWKLIEAAEIIKSTYSGWHTSDIQKFKDMLVYPGYSNTTIPAAAIASGDHTLYWLIYQGDPARHGNQGIFGMRVMMAMGVFLDNEIMYDRAVRYLKGYPHRIDDLPYPSGPPTSSGLKAIYEHFEEYNFTGLSNEVVDYGYNEVISSYIYENGQCQESSRDQAHAHGGVATLCTMAEIDWNQGGNLYGHLDNRLLLGLSFWYRYNLSWVESFPDQLTPWEPTVESGEYLERFDRSGRWKALKINPYLAQTITDDVWHRGRKDLLVSPALESNLGHYKYRMNLPFEDIKWLERGFDFLTNEIGLEQLTTTDFPGLGGLKYRRVSPGDPISGFDANGLPKYDMNLLPLTIEAENYDFFAVDGQGKIYNDLSATNSGGVYRTDEKVDIKDCSEGGYTVTDIQDGEWLTYTVSVPTNGVYDLSIRYAAGAKGGKIKFNFGENDVTSQVDVPFGASFSTGLDDYKDLKVGDRVRLTRGVQAMKVLFSGTNNAFELNHMTLNLVKADPEPVNLAPLFGTASQSIESDPCPYGGCAELAIDGNTDGNFGNGSVSHSAHGTNDSLKWWQVDLDRNYHIETINIYNRSGYEERLNNFTVEVTDVHGNTTFNELYVEAPKPMLSINTGGVEGSVVRINKTSQYAVSLAEVEVYGVGPSLSNKQFDTFDAISISPNPVESEFIIESNMFGADLQIFNVLGKIVLQTTVKKNKQKVDISHLESGLYFIHLNNYSEKLIRKIIKK